jgi:glycosyltransferase involved in cell wall biosynthesis
MNLKFSIVIPNYNSGEVLERAILSLISQRYPALELIMADSESRDASRQIIERYRQVFHTVLTEKDRGQADGLNRGFSRATGDIFGWLGADDELLPGALCHVAEIFDRNPDADVVIGCCERIFPDGSTCVTPADPDAWGKIGIQNVIDQPSVFWAAGLHRRLGQLNTNYQLAFDWDFWCRMRDAGARLITTERILSRYDLSGPSKTGSAGKLHADESFRILRNYGPYRGGLAYVYRFLYEHFDLAGCYDRPLTCSPSRADLFAVSIKTLKWLIGEKLVYMYNWHFASCQQRNLKWW